ncbi:MAG: hypothetical protein ACRENW_08390 [Thermodesulfobacteriota bacterium]
MIAKISTTQSYRNCFKPRGRQVGSMIDDIAGMLASKIGLTADQAKAIMPLVMKTLLQKADPTKASGMLSALPSGLTNIFSNDEKKEFTTTQRDVSDEEIVNEIDAKAGINDKAKSRQAYQESMNILEGKFGKDALLGNVTEKIKNVDLNPFG